MALRIPANTALEKWKELARKQAAPAHVRLYKQYTAEIKAESDGIYRFAISTGSVDRDYDTLAVDGWRLENYVKNPVVLWAHQYGQFPIGQAVEVSKDGGVLTARMRFVPAETYAIAGTARALVDGGFLRATSVGFDPLKWVWNDERGGYDFVEQELLEFSLVPVPANPEALIAAAARGIDLLPLKSWAEGILEGIEPGLWLPKAAAERALKAPTTVTLQLDGAVIATVVKRLEKAGRTISPVIEERIRTAKDADGVVLAVLDQVLDPVNPDPDPKGGEPFQLPAFMTDEIKIRAAVRAATTDAVTQQVRRAQGRLD